MSFTTVSTKATGDTVSQSDWNTYIRDNEADLDARISANTFSGCILTRASNQSIPDTTNTLVSWTAETLDVGGWFTPSGTTITVPAGAIPSGYTNIIVEIGCLLVWAGNTVGTRKMEIYQNGASLFVLDTVSPPDATNLTIVRTSLPIPAVAGDTFAINVAQSSTGALNLIGATSTLRFSIKRSGYY